MTIKQARKILGKLAKDISDNDIQLEIESATLLKDIFFKLYIAGMNHKAKTSDSLVNNVK